ncbi:MAG: hypothetical protein RMJ44_12425, partial [Cytophagales bacterium]|nr:hypothetical protein [Bacteroidia bacterium]MDW8211880.1 hypothetical protein [Cytophagales bacterium]
MNWKQDFIISLKDKRYKDGFRSLSGKYLEHLAGFTLKGIANAATYGSAMELIQQASTIAVDFAVEDVLTRMQCLGQIKIIAQSLPTLWNDTYADDYSNEVKGIEVIKYNPQYQPLSTWRVTKVHLLANDTVAGKQVQLIDGSTVLTFTVDIVAGQPTSIDLTNDDKTLGYLVKHPERFSVVWDLSDVRPATWTWANHQMNNNQSCGCTSKKAIGRWYYVKGNHGIALDMAYVCDFSRLAQNIAYMMSQAILYRFGAHLAEEIIGSDRINFFTNNSVEWAEKRKEELLDLYNKELEKVLPSITQTVVSIDYNCFDVRRNVLVEMRV